MINFFLYCIKKMNFSGSPNGTPHDWCRRTMKKDYFAMKTNGIRWSSSKNDDEYFHWGPIFYVCSSARNWVSSMYKGIYHIRNSLWGVATVDVWSSSTRPFQQKNRSPEMINFFLYCTLDFQTYPEDWFGWIRSVDDPRPLLFLRMILGSRNALVNFWAQATMVLHEEKHRSVIIS